MILFNTSSGQSFTQSILLICLNIMTESMYIQRLNYRILECEAMDGNCTFVLGCTGPHGNRVQYDIHVTPMGENDCHTS